MSTPQSWAALEVALATNGLYLERFGVVTMVVIRGRQAAVNAREGGRLGHPAPLGLLDSRAGCAHCDTERGRTLLAPLCEAMAPGRLGAAAVNAICRDATRHQATSCAASSGHTNRHVF